MIAAAGGVAAAPQKRIIPGELAPRDSRLDPLLLLGLGSLICLVPLAAYLLYAGGLNARTPPTLVPGPWDFAAVLLGLSGFLLLAGPLLLSVLDSHLRSYLYGNWADLRSVGSREVRAWSFMAAGYLMIVGSLVSLLLRLRRRLTAIYNVVPEAVESALTTVLEDKGFAWRRGVGRIEISAGRGGEITAAVRVTVFPVTGHAALRWYGDYAGVRHDVEAALPGALAGSAANQNPTAGWLYTAAVSLLVVLFAWTVVVIYLVVTDPRV